MVFQSCIVSAVPWLGELPGLGEGSALPILGVCLSLARYSRGSFCRVCGCGGRGHISQVLVCLKMP